MFSNPALYASFPICWNNGGVDETIVTMLNAETTGITTLISLTKDYQARLEETIHEIMLNKVIGKKCNAFIICYSLFKIHFSIKLKTSFSFLSS